MATPSGILAVVRAARPNFRSRHDKLAFSVHSVVSLAGYKLVALGEDAYPTGDQPVPTAECSLDGWNDQDGQYSMLYQPDNTSGAALQVKCLALNEKLLVNLLSHLPNSEPQSLELDVTKYTTGAEAAGSAYTNLQELAVLLQSALDSAEGKVKVQQPTASTAPATTTTTTSTSQQPARHPDDDPLRIGPPRYPSRNPLMVGGNDRFPAGIPPPGGMPYGGGIPMQPGMGGGGGMMVGPDHPMFAERLRHPEMRPGQLAPPGLPPGARWDPIRPPGLQGYHPDDFQRGGRGGMHPDIMPRPPGGSDWDNMYG